MQAFGNIFENAYIFRYETRRNETIFCGKKNMQFPRKKKTFLRFFTLYLRLFFQKSLKTHETEYNMPLYQKTTGIIISA